MPLTFDDIVQDTSHLDFRQIQIEKVHDKYNRIRDAKLASLSELVWLLLDLLEVIKAACQFSDYTQALKYLDKYHQLKKQFKLETFPYIQNNFLTMWNIEVKATHTLLYKAAQLETQTSNPNYQQALILLEQCMLLDPKQTSAANFIKKIKTTLNNQLAAHKKEYTLASLLVLSMPTISASTLYSDDADNKEMATLTTAATDKNSSVTIETPSQPISSGTLAL